MRERPRGPEVLEWWSDGGDSTLHVADLCASGLTYADILLLEMLCYAADECRSSLATILDGAPRVLSLYRRLVAFEHVAEYVTSARRKPPPDAAFVRRTCGILGMKVPAHAQAPRRAGASSTAKWFVVASVVLVVMTSMGSTRRARG